LGTGASPTSRPNPTSATADATAAVRARTELDRIKAALADLDAVAAAGSGNSIIRDLRRLMPALTARADSVEATYYLIETNLVLDRPREACILLARIRRPSRGSPFEAGVDRFLSDSTLACGSRRQ
jgi:hypothetical protein